MPLLPEVGILRVVDSLKVLLYRASYALGKRHLELCHFRSNVVELVLVRPTDRVVLVLQELQQLISLNTGCLRFLAFGNTLPLGG